MPHPSKGEKRSVVGTHSNTDGLLKNTSTKYNKYVATGKHELSHDISFRELCDRIGVGFFLQNKIFFSLLRQVVSWHFIFMKQKLANSFNLFFSLDWGIVVGMVEKSVVLMLFMRTRTLIVCTLNKSLFFVNLHLIHTSSGIASTPADIIYVTGNNIIVLSRPYTLSL